MFPQQLPLINIEPKPDTDTGQWLMFSDSSSDQGTIENNTCLPDNLTSKMQYQQQARIVHNIMAENKNILLVLDEPVLRLNSTIRVPLTIAVKNNWFIG